jgi:predicted NACHT family NTPase
MEDSASSLPNNNSDPSPQVQQNVEGDGNQVIGQVTGGNVFGNITGNVTIYEGVPVSSMPPPIEVLPTLTQQEYRQRQVLLDKVKKFWVKGVLENSLHSRALIELGLQERPDLVQQPFSGVAEFSDAPGQVLPDGTHATAVFEEMGEGRTLLILGEPGAGKTIALLKLAEDLVIRTVPDLRQQIPVVFNLSSWTRKPQTIEKWLVQELQEKYQVSKALGETWVKSEALILLMDGLDEVRADQRNSCVQALNLFTQNHGTTEVVVCCRIRDYQALKDRLTLRSAICIQPLTPKQVNNYFDQAGEQLSSLKIVLPLDEVLQELATSPLMLSIMSLAYQDFTPEQLTLGGKSEDYRKRLFETYVDRMFQRRGLTKQYPRVKTQKWLSWMAKQMITNDQTIFLIERLQPSWLPTKEQRIRFRLERCRK